MDPLTNTGSVMGAYGFVTAGSTTRTTAGAWSFTVPKFKNWIRITIKGAGGGGVGVTITTDDVEGGDSMIGSETHYGYSAGGNGGVTTFSQGAMVANGGGGGTSRFAPGSAGTASGGDSNTTGGGATGGAGYVDGDGGAGGKSVKLYSKGAFTPGSTLSGSVGAAGTAGGGASPGSPGGVGSVLIEWA